MALATAEVCVSRPQPAASYPQPHKTPSPEARAPPGDAGSRGARLLFKSWNGRSHTIPSSSSSSWEEGAGSQCSPQGQREPDPADPGGPDPEPRPRQAWESPSSLPAVRAQPLHTRGLARRAASQRSKVCVPGGDALPRDVGFSNPGCVAFREALSACGTPETEKRRRRRGRGHVLEDSSRGRGDLRPPPPSGASRAPQAAYWGPSARAPRPPSPGGGTWAAADPAAGRSRLNDPAASASQVPRSQIPRPPSRPQPQSQSLRAGCLHAESDLLSSLLAQPPQWDPLPSLLLSYPHPPQTQCWPSRYELPAFTAAQPAAPAGWRDC